MATATLKRARAGNVSQTALDQVGSLLQDLPEKTKEQISLRDAVAQLQEVIKGALARGYSYEDVAIVLAEQAIVISPATLKRYVLTHSSQAKQKKAPTKTRAKRTAKAPLSEPISERVEPEREAEQEEAIVPTKTPTEAKSMRGRRQSAPVEEISEVEAEQPEAKSSRRGRPPKTAAAPQRSSATRGRRAAKA